MDKSTLAGTNTWRRSKAEREKNEAQRRDERVLQVHIMSPHPFFRHKPGIHEEISTALMKKFFTPEGAEELLNMHIPL